MPVKIRILKASLRKSGCYQVSQEGSHTKWKHPSVSTVILILSGDDGSDARPYQEKEVRKFLQLIEIAKRRLK